MADRDQVRWLRAVGGGDLGVSGGVTEVAGGDVPQGVSRVDGVCVVYRFGGVGREVQGDAGGQEVGGGEGVAVGGEDLGVAAAVAEFAGRDSPQGVTAVGGDGAGCRGGGCGGPRVGRLRGCGRGGECRGRDRGGGYGAGVVDGCGDSRGGADEQQSAADKGGGGALLAGEQPEAGCVDSVCGGDEFGDDRDREARPGDPGGEGEHGHQQRDLVG